MIHNSLTTSPPLTLEQLIHELYKDLHKLARARTRHMPRWRSLHTTDLIHEAFLHLKRREQREWSRRSYFLAAFKQAIHHASVEYTRRKCALKRGGLAPHTNDISAVLDNDQARSPDRLLVLEALQRLHNDHPNAAELVLLRLYFGMSIAEISKFQGKSRRTIERTWTFARSWLELELGGRPE